MSFLKIRRRLRFWSHNCNCLLQFFIPVLFFAVSLYQFQPSIRIINYLINRVFFSNCVETIFTKRRKNFISDVCLEPFGRVVVGFKGEPVKHIFRNKIIFRNFLRKVELAQVIAYCTPTYIFNSVFCLDKTKSASSIFIVNLSP